MSETIRKADARRMLKRGHNLFVADVDGTTWATDSYVMIRADWVADGSLPEASGCYVAKGTGWEKDPVREDVPTVDHIIKAAGRADVRAPITEAMDARIMIHNPKGPASTIVLHPDDGTDRACDHVHIWAGYAPILVTAQTRGVWDIMTRGRLSPTMIADDRGPAVIIMPVRVG